MAGKHQKAKAIMTLQHSPYHSEIDDNDEEQAVTPTMLAMMFPCSSRRDQ
jgi:hypothetical protein